MSSIFCLPNNHHLKIGSPPLPPPWSTPPSPAPTLTEEPAPAKLLRRAPAAPSPPPTSCPAFIKTDIDHNLTTSVANASHGGSSIWSVDLLFFKAS